MGKFRGALTEAPAEGAEAAEDVDEKSECTRTHRRRKSGSDGS